MAVNRKHAVIKVEDIRPGMLVYAPPGKLIVQDVLTTQSLKSQQKDKHPLVVLSVNPPKQEITVTYLASFSKAGRLADVKIVESAKKLLLPVSPAPKEYLLDAIDWEFHWNPEHVGCWVSVRSKKRLIGTEVRPLLCILLDITSTLAANFILSVQGFRPIL